MPGPVFLEGDELALRLVQEADLEFLASLWNDPSVRHQAGNLTTSFPEEEIQDFLDKDDTTNFLPWHEGEAVGHVMIYHVDTEASNAELAYVIDPEKAGNGYATEAADLCLRHAFDALGLQKVYARVQEHNEPSMRVLEKLGFQEEGVFRDHYFSFGEYVDEHRFGLLQSEW